MNTFSSIEKALENAPADIVSIIEIEHASAGRCYIRAKCWMPQLAAALARRPMPEIKRLIAETRVERKMERKISLREQRQQLADCCRFDISAGERAWEREDEVGWARAQKAENSAVAAARAQLAKFDLEHPEVLAEIKRENEEEIKRAMWH